MLSECGGAPHFTCLEKPRLICGYETPFGGLREVGRQFSSISYFYGFVFLVKFLTAAGLIKTESCCIFIR